MARARRTAITKSTKRYIYRVPRVIPAERIVVNNHVRPIGFPDVPLRWQGFRAWTDVPTGQIAVAGAPYRVIGCRCGWAPHLPEHYRVNFDGPTQEAK
jgi:hypothetical protein